MPPAKPPETNPVGEISVPATFFERARREAERYGDDPWIFLRELVQNSRDAGATRIEFRARVTEATETISCDDDGRGMTREDVSRYLLRLYASGKAPADDDGQAHADAVGRFGVGFWSVLRFAPALIRVDSKTKDALLGLEIDCVRQSIREVPCTRETIGTRVTVVRPVRESSNDERLLPLVADRLRHFAGTVKGVAGAPPPELLLEGRPLNRTFKPRGFIAEHVSGRGFEGVIGLADKPTVRLYAHGLLVKEVTSLEELLPRRSKKAAGATPGLFARAEINADGLEVLLDRQAVVEDKLLETIVATCDGRLRRLRRKLVDRLAPLPWFLRLLLPMRDPRRWLPVMAAAFALTASGVIGVVVSSWQMQVPATTGSVTARAAPRQIENALLPGAGPVINTPESALEASVPWDIRYQGPGRPFIKLITQGRYQPGKGLLSDPIRLVGRYEAEPDPGAGDASGYKLFIGIAGGERRLLLPLPTGQRLIDGSIFVDDRLLETLGRTRHDEPVLLDIPQGSSQLRYRTTRASLTQAPSDLDAPPLDDLPKSLTDHLEQSLSLVRISDRIYDTQHFVNTALRYTTAQSDARRFSSQGGPWIERVLSFGAGDCDVMNGLNVLTLRSLGIYARLGVGFVGNGSGVAPDLHAWTEYWDGENWQVIDVSPARFVPGRTSNPSHARPRTARTAPHDPLPGVRYTQNDDRASAAEATPSSQTDLTSNWPANAELSTSQRYRLGLMVLITAAALFLIVALIFWRRERRQRQQVADVDDQVALALLEHLLREASGSDPLHLRHRPIFRTLAGNRISLDRIEELARKGRLLAARPHNALLSKLTRGLPVLDRNDPRVERFRDQMRELIVLEEVEELLTLAQSNTAIDDAGRVLTARDPGLRVHGLERSDQIREIALPTAHKGALSPRHLLIGLRDPVIAAALALWPQDPALARFRLLKRILEQSTFYLEVRDDVLAAAAQEAL